MSGAVKKDSAITASSEAMGRSQIVATLSKKYPKFTKMQMCMVLHPERYGVCLTSEAQSYLQDIYPEIGKPYVTRRRRKTNPPRRKKANRLSVYVDDEELALVKERAEEAGCATMQEYLTTLLRR